MNMYTKYVGTSLNFLKIKEVIRVPVEHKRRKTCPMFLCDCLNCGSVNVLSDVYRVISGHTTSCGCRQKVATTTHNKSNSITYSSWLNMKSRCCNPKNPHFHNYGGRGITVCQKWLDSFENFLADMGERPRGKTLDRINNELGYHKDNCKWSTPKEQSLNTRDVIKIEGKTLEEISIKSKLSIGCLRARYSRTKNKSNLTIESIVERKFINHFPTLTLNGVTERYSFWEKQTGINRGTIKARLRNGWSVEKSLTTPVKSK